MGNQQTITPTSTLTKIPLDYPTYPVEGKIQRLWERNYHSIYHSLSPYTDYNMGLIPGFTKEPFYYTFIDESNKGLNALKKYDSQMFPIGSAPIDVIRVSKFLGSGNGIKFLGTQFLLQTGNAFNETRIYNPTSPIIAAGMGLALGTIRPQRNFDTSAGLGGIARTLIGNSIPDAIFGMPTVNQPSGTATGALTGGPNEKTGGKGILRAGTANRGLTHLMASWSDSNAKGTSLNKTFGKIAKEAFKSMFSNFIPESQDGIYYKSDESTYGLMISSGHKFGYRGNSNEFGFTQIWQAGGMTSDNRIRKSKNPFSSRISNSPDGKTSIVLPATDGVSGNPTYIIGVGRTGIEIKESGDSLKPGIRYGDSVGASINDRFEASTIMVDYSNYTQPGNLYPTKFNDASDEAKSAGQINKDLKKVLDNIRNASEGLYRVDVNSDATTIRSGDYAVNGYDRLFNTTQGQSRAVNGSATKYPLGMLKDYKNTKVVDDTLGSQKSMRMPTNGKFDALNTLTVLSKKDLQSGKLPEWNKLNLKGWNNKQWNAYENDQIAFYFYDVVNEKYIPFRAAIKGLSENSNASWEELPFIGRGDKVYSYGGFNRSLSLTISIMIGSIAELAPTWQRINYLTTLVKPANYTSATVNSVINRFMIPPMVMLTLGDMYKDQPILFQSITTTIPDETSWETLNENNMSNKEWEYLAGYIKAPNVLYGQLPLAVDISVTAFLLEKERAIVGGANFGHAPRKDDWLYWNNTSIQGTIPNSKEPNSLHSSLVVDVTKIRSEKIDAGTRVFESVLSIA